MKLVAAHHPEGLRLTDLVQLSGLEFPTAHRLLASLLREGLVAQQETGKRYVLGQYCQQLSLAAHNKAPVQNIYAPLLEDKPLDIDIPYAAPKPLGRRISWRELVK